MSLQPLHWQDSSRSWKSETLLALNSTAQEQPTHQCIISVVFLLKPSYQTLRRKSTLPGETRTGTKSSECKHNSKILIWFYLNRYLPISLGQDEDLQFKLTEMLCFLFFFNWSFSILSLVHIPINMQLFLFVLKSQTVFEDPPWNYVRCKLVLCCKS